LFVFSADNGFNPIWNESFDFEVPIPELAMIRFVVQDEDMFGDPNFIGQASYPVSSVVIKTIASTINQKLGRLRLCPLFQVQCMRQGFRSVPLQSNSSEELELASLLVHLTVKSARVS